MRNALAVWLGLSSLNIFACESQLRLTLLEQLKPRVVGQRASLADVTTNQQRVGHIIGLFVDSDEGRPEQIYFLDIEENALVRFEVPLLSKFQDKLRQSISVEQLPKLPIVQTHDFDHSEAHSMVNVMKILNFANPDRWASKGFFNNEQKLSEVLGLFKNDIRVIKVDNRHNFMGRTKYANDNLGILGTNPLLGTIFTVQPELKEAVSFDNLKNHLQKGLPAYLDYHAVLRDKGSEIKKLIDYTQEGKEVKDYSKHHLTPVKRASENQLVEAVHHTVVAIGYIHPGQLITLDPYIGELQIVFQKDLEASYEPHYLLLE